MTGIKFSRAAKSLSDYFARLGESLEARETAAEEKAAEKAAKKAAEKEAAEIAAVRAAEREAAAAVSGQAAGDASAAAPEPPKADISASSESAAPEETGPAAAKDGGDGAFRISGDPRIEEERRRAAENEKARKNRRLKIALVVVPFVLIAALVVSTVPSFLKYRDAYAVAESFLNEGRYTDAQNAFVELGSYSDAQEKVLFEIPYRKAAEILKCAVEDDSSGLKLAGIEKSDIGEDETAQLLLYRKAAEMFSALGGYSDSDSKLAVANAGIDEFYEKKKLTAYNEALALLESGQYLPAREAFMRLMDYRDSTELSMECLYRRAEKLLEYAKNNNVRKISIKLSNESGTQSVISVPKSFLVEQTGDAVSLIELKDACGPRSAELIYEDIPGDGFLPLCDAVAAQFGRLNGYRDSVRLKSEAEEAGDFTREFFELCESGYLSKAYEWLNRYDDQFEQRETYEKLIDMFLPYCRFWQLSRGDSSLIPFAAGQHETCESFMSLVAIRDSAATLKIIPMDREYSYQMEYSAEADGFRTLPDESTAYFAIITRGVFTISRYNALIGYAASSCEYCPAE